MALLGGRYELAEPLGSGGMARVVAAYDRVLDRRVAIKLINDAQLGDPSGRERFAREARAAAALQHSNTVGVFDVGDDDGRPFIVMELVDGRSLADRLATEGRLSPAETVRIGDAVLAGLAAAHARGLVHRDIKPSNILLARDGAVKLADFGIATALAESTGRLTGTGQIVGTTRYLAPECAAGQRATEASDLYSLGAVLYECVAGRAPFEAETPIALAVAHQRAPVQPLASVAPAVPEAVAASVERALAKDPAARFASAATMRQALGGTGGAAALPGAARADATAAVPSPIATAELAADGEQTEVAPADRPPRAFWPLLAGSVAVVAVAFALLYYLVTRDDDAEGAVPPADPGGELSADEDPNAHDGELDAGDEPDDEPPATLDDLIVVTAADTGGIGEKGDDLLDDLIELRAEPSAAGADDLIQDIADWIADGELDAEIGRAAITVLEETSWPADE